MQYFKVGRGQTLNLALVFTAVLAIGLAAARAPAHAQENLDHGKSAAQLYASSCAMCHKSVQGLNKAGGAFGGGLEGFLREHYTASRETAAILARYVQGQSAAPGTPEKRGRRNAQGGDKPKDGAGKPAKPAAAGSDDKPAEPKVDAKSEAKSEAKPDVKPEAAPEPKPAAEPKSESKPDAKPVDGGADKPAKSD